jgi:hypothetical protein
MQPFSLFSQTVHFFGVNVESKYDPGLHLEHSIELH